MYYIIHYIMQDRRREKRIPNAICTTRAGSSKRGAVTCPMVEWVVRRQGSGAVEFSRERSSRQRCYVS